MSADEYLAAYAERHKYTVEQLRHMGASVKPCRCGLAGCHGWAIDWTNAPLEAPGAER